MNSVEKMARQFRVNKTIKEDWNEDILADMESRKKK
jgi:hypothetical protein